MTLAKARLFSVLLALALSQGCDDSVQSPIATDRYSEASFQRWLATADGRQEKYDRFEAFLAGQQVSDIVPAWQLLRTDANYAARCGLGAFELPAEEKWLAIVPTLRLVRDDVIPAVGPVEVLASNRSTELNDCVNGATGSRHLAFAAVDLVAPERTDKRELFADLCAMHERVGARSRMGLGAYYDPARPQASRQGRFHVDASGFRTWGFGFTRATSACVTMRQA